MLVFPQLMTYPTIRRTLTRTVVNQLADGRRVTFDDPDAALQHWELRASGLTGAEWNSVETLFSAVSGRLGTFTFLDPAGNLLTRSEEFGSAEWNKDPLINLSTGVDDPFGTMRATRAANNGFTAQDLAQTLAVPGSFQYVLSVWARGSSMTFFANAAQKTFALGSQWTRVVMPVELGDNSESITFGVRLEAGASADLFGMQVETQIGASDYKKTQAHGGVYSAARFVDDQLTVTARGTDVFDLAVRIVTRGI